MSACLAEDELYDLAHGAGLEGAPAAEAHLADCAACSALVAALLDAPAEAPAWGGLVGRRLGPYRLDAQIGAGGMGAVYQAWDERLRRKIAVKVWPAQGEARAAASIAHPNVAAVHDVGRDGELGWIAMELIDGESLRSVLARGPLAPARVRALALALARGLAAAHAQGVVHRDLKPENLLLTRDGTLKIVDFGLARVDGDEVEVSGQVRGTVGYLAPEQARGEPVDGRADLFAAGAILYEMASGRRAFAGASHAERLAAVLRDAPATDGLGPLAPVIARLLDKDPARRFQSAEDLAWVLEREDPAPVRAPGVTRRALLGGVLAAGAVGAIAGRLWPRRSPRPATPSFRPLTYRHGRVMTARLSRDGARAIYGAAWDGDPLAVFDQALSGGVARRLDLPSADLLALSSHDMAIGIGRGFAGDQSATGRLALAPLDGGAPRLLDDGVQDADFAPDGETLAIVRRGDDGFTLEWPPGQVLHRAPWITHPRISPDGARIACLVHPAPTDDRGELVVVARGGGARSLAGDWDSAAGVAWKDADTLWFTAARTGADCAIHEIAAGGGEPRVVVQTPGRLRLHDLGADRRALVSVDAWRMRTLIGSPGDAELDRSLSEFSIVVDRSSDGRTLLVGELGDVEAALGVYLTPWDGGAPLHLGAGIPIALSPSGRRVLAALPGDRLHAIVYATEGADQPPLPLGDLVDLHRAAWLDDERVVLVGNLEGAASRLWIARIGGDAPAPLGDDGLAGAIALDHARARVALVDRDGGLRLVDVATGATSAVPGHFAGQVVCSWLDDGGVALRTLSAPIAITRVDPATGATAPLFTIAPPPIGLKAVDNVVLTADARRYAYSYGQELSQLHLMTMS